MVGRIYQATTNQITIENCVNKGKINTTTAQYAGGILGATYESATVTIRGCSNDGEITAATSCAGGIAGYTGSGLNIINCHNTKKIAAGNTNQIGGIIGYFNSNVGSISNCTSNCTLNCSGTGAVGGIAARTEGITITGCTAKGTIKGTCSNAGGIVGTLGSGSVTNCNNEANINITSADRAGGIVGYSMASSGTISGCTSNCTFTVSGCTNVGGISGNCVGVTVTNCTAKGSLTSKSTQVGGIIGIKTAGTTSRCINQMSITLNTNSSYAGGIVSKATGGSILECINKATISLTSGAQFASTGGIVGYCSTDVRRCANRGVIKCLSTNDGRAGGIMGTGAGAVIANCYNVNNIEASGSYSAAAGILAHQDSSTSMANCYNTGSTSSAARQGGIYAFGGTATNCHTTPDYTLANMKKDAFVTTLGSAYHKDSNSKNSGLPVLTWQYNNNIY